MVWNFIRVCSRLFCCDSSSVDCKGDCTKEYTALVVPPEIKLGNATDRTTRIPSGMFDANGSFDGVAATEFERVGLKMNMERLVNMSHVCKQCNNTLDHLTSLVSYIYFRS